MTRFRTPRSVRPRTIALLPAVALAAGLALAVAADVSLPGTQPADGSGDPAFPPLRDGAAPGTLEAPDQCVRCHGRFRRFTDEVHEPFDSWAGSLMANASRDPLFWAALDIANQDDALLGDIGVGDFCLRCHVPQAWYTGRSTCDTPWGESFDGACLEGSPDQGNDDFEGLTCAFCHRMYDASDPPAGDFEDPLAPRVGNGQVYLSSDHERVRGPYPDAQDPQHPWAHSPFHRDSAFCGQCHDVTSPVHERRDPATGASLGYLLPIERTFTEHQQSRYADATAPEASTCQDCHMPQADPDGDGLPDAVLICTESPLPRGPGSALGDVVRTHLFAGANAWMLEVLKDEFGGPLFRDLSFDASIAATRDLLETRTATVSIDAPPSTVAGGELEVVVRVTNLAGHKLPTGYPEGKRAWVHVAVGVDEDSDGTLTPSERAFESGAHDPVTGAVERDAQARVYEMLLGIWDWNSDGQCDHEEPDGRELFHFVLNDCIVSDNRIPPLGFTPDRETEPVGTTYPENPALPGTLAHWDDVTYRLPVPVDADLAGEVLVEATLHLQATSPEYVEFLVEESDWTCDPLDDGCDPTQPDDRPNRAEKLRELWERHDRAPPETLASARAAVPVDPAPTGACCVGARCFELTAAGCDDQVGDYLGDDVACGAIACDPPSGPPPGEASDVLAGAAPLRVSRASTDADVLSLTWAPACDAIDHAVYFGDLDALGAGGLEWTSLECGLPLAGAADVTAPTGSTYFIVVGRSAREEGRYGRDADGVDRAESVDLAPCDFPQADGGC